MPAAQDGFSTSEHDWHSRDYVEWWLARDRGREAERRQRIREMLAQAGFARPADIAVLDVGGGYGLASEEVLTAFPEARVCLQDCSQPMLDEARRRLAGYAPRVRFVRADLLDPSWTAAVGGPFDLAVSAIAIHNLRALPAIAACYRAIAGVLKPGAPFLDYDLFDIAGGLAVHEALLMDAGFARLACLRRQGPAAAVAAYAAGAPADRPLPAGPR